MLCVANEALRCKEEGVSRAILLQPIWVRYFDMRADTDSFEVKQVDAALDSVVLEKSLTLLPAFG